MSEGYVTTLTQAGFSFCAWCVGPLWGLWGAAIVRGTRLHSLLGFGVAAAGAWSGWAASAVAARTLHPDYPQGGPPEAVALWYLLPGFISGAASIALLYRRALASPRIEDAAPPEPPPSRPSWPTALAYRRSPGRPEQAGTPVDDLPRSLLPKRLGWAVAIPCITLGYGACQHELSMWRFRGALPLGADRVHEWAHEDGFPDSGYLYRLKAKVNAAEFDMYMHSLGLSPHGPTRRHANFAWQPKWRRSDRETPWFDPSPDLSGTFVSAGSGCRSAVMAKLEEGWVYVEAHAVDNGIPTECD